MTHIAAFFYVAAMLLANLLVSKFGPAISPVLAFLLIGFDLSMRDWLHVRLSAKQMVGLIGVAGLLTYALNPAAGMIAVASTAAFTSAALVDYQTFKQLRGSWLFRANGSNVAGAAVDSIVFVALVPFKVDPITATSLFLAKVAGGAIWATLMNHASKKVEA